MWQNFITQDQHIVTFYGTREVMKPFGLKSNSYDSVVAASSFHWINSDLFLSKFL